MRALIRSGERPAGQCRAILLLPLLLLLVSCGSTHWDHTPQYEHVVRSGETLIKIAWRYGKDYRDLAQWNGLGSGALIYPGQVLRLTPPAGSTASTRDRATKPGPMPRWKFNPFWIR